jgi:hypothetical protein
MTTDLRLDTLEHSIFNFLYLVIAFPLCIFLHVVLSFCP